MDYFHTEPPGSLAHGTTTNSLRPGYPIRPIPRYACALARQAPVNQSYPIYGHSLGHSSCVPIYGQSNSSTLPYHSVEDMAAKNFPLQTENSTQSRSCWAVDESSIQDNHPTSGNQFSVMQTISAPLFVTAKATSSDLVDPSNHLESNSQNTPHTIDLGNQDSSHEGLNNIWGTGEDRRDIDHLVQGNEHRIYQIWFISHFTHLCLSDSEKQVKSNSDETTVVFRSQHHQSKHNPNGNSSITL